jgi:hypothetical protein
VLLFTTSEEPIVYCMKFSKLGTVFQHDEAFKTAVPAVDLTEVEFSEGKRLVTCRMHEDLLCPGLHSSVTFVGPTEFLLLKT